VLRRSSVLNLIGYFLWIGLRYAAISQGAELSNYLDSLTIIKIECAAAPF
jgi:hypothetical protein